MVAYLYKGGKVRDYPVTSFYINSIIAIVMYQIWLITSRDPFTDGTDRWWITASLYQGSATICMGISESFVLLELSLRLRFAI